MLYTWGGWWKGGGSVLSSIAVLQIGQILSDMLWCWIQQIPLSWFSDNPILSIGKQLDSSLKFLLSSMQYPLTFDKSNWMLEMFVIWVTQLYNLSKARHFTLQNEKQIVMTVLFYIHYNFFLKYCILLIIWIYIYYKQWIISYPLQ